MMTVLRPDFDTGGDWLARNPPRISDCKSASFFKRQIFDTNSVLNYLLPPKRNEEAIDKLRNVKPYELIKTHTDRLKKSFLRYYLRVYQ